jgi:hypothetical protein
LAFFGYQYQTSLEAIAGQLKIVIATDESEQEVGKDMIVNAAALRITLLRNVPQTLYAVHQVPPERFTAGAILAEIDGLGVAPDDSVFVYYGGHGAYDPERKTYVMASGDEGRAVLFASQIRDAVEAKKARLSVIILDCCKTLRPIKGEISFPAPEVPPTQVSPLFNRLFFQPSGTVVIESSAPGEYALILPQHQLLVGQDGPKQNKGSLFTNCLSGVLNDKKFMTRPLSWSEICRETQLRMDDMFGQICPGGRLSLGSGEIVEQNSQNIVGWINGNPIAVR